ncbi:hypothetical protein ACFC09_03170 [Streptomyces sp. NPDC056161]|uniref:hypothetical protein n=1 Tax=Streptomyces sp. NPDC056161 TaxID=3345732 RepID=UPI0035E3317F
MKKGTVITVLVIAGLLALSMHGRKETAVLPDSTGRVLRAAQEATRQAGFTTIASHDALGKKRMQFLGGNWKVCTQTPAAGRHAATAQVDFAVVKLGERCP